MIVILGAVKPSSIRLSQSLSNPSQSSGAPGYIAGLLSLQSVPPQALSAKLSLSLSLQVWVQKDEQVPGLLHMSLVNGSLSLQSRLDEQVGGQSPAQFEQVSPFIASQTLLLLQAEIWIVAGNIAPSANAGTSLGFTWIGFEPGVG